MELHKSCHGNWYTLLGEGADTDEAKHELRRFLEYAALFLSNMGNYYVCSLSHADTFMADNARLAGPRGSEVHS